MKKKKNDEANRNRFIAIATILVVMLIFGIVLLVNTIMNRPFSQTMPPLGATNLLVATLLEETSVATTERFIMMSTALP